MPIDPNGVTLADYALMSNDPKIAEIAMCMVKAGSVFKYVPIITKKSLTLNGTRIIDLPNPTWANLGDDPTIQKTRPKPYQETFYFWREGVTFDRYLLMEENAISDIVDIQTKALIEARTYELNDAFINNVHRAIPNRRRSASVPLAEQKKCFVGLRERLDNPVYGMISADCKRQSAADLSDANISGAQANKLIREFQTLLDAMGAPMGEDCISWWSDDLVARIEYGIRDMGAGGGFEMTKDAFDRNILTYRNCKIERIGRVRPQDGGSQPYIISSTESQNGDTDTTGTYTSVYVAKLNKQTLHAWQFEEPFVEPEYHLEKKVLKQANFEGGYGINVPNNRAIGRLHGIKVA
jgi:hypothetical protein